MDHAEKSPAGAGTPPGLEDETRRNHTTKPPKKIMRILARFVLGGSLNRFEAEALHDHVLNTTVSKIERKGIRIARTDEVVPGFRGLPTHVKRYRLDPDPANVSRAREVLALEFHDGRVSA